MQRLDQSYATAMSMTQSANREATAARRQATSNSALTLVAALRQLSINMQVVCGKDVFTARSDD